MRHRSIRGQNGSGQGRAVQHFVRQVESARTGALECSMSRKTGDPELRRSTQPRGSRKLLGG